MGSWPTRCSAVRPRQLCRCARLPASTTSSGSTYNHLRNATHRLAQRLRVGFQPYLERVKAGAPPADVFEAFDHFRVLCAHRSGPLGTIALNRHIEALLQTAKLLDARAPWYPGRPVMITRNDYHLRLFNGDVGITLPDPEANGQLRVYFPTADGGMRPAAALPLARA